MLQDIKILIVHVHMTPKLLEIKAYLPMKFKMTQLMSVTLTRHRLLESIKQSLSA